MTNALIVLSTRIDPTIPLGRLRSTGELLEIRSKDLEFTAEESVELLNGSFGLQLSKADIELLYWRTEGWPAGLQLASLGMRSSADRALFLSSFGGSTRHVVDYLTEVVLDTVDDDVRDFLLETAVLTRLSGSLCDAVTGLGESVAMLDKLDKMNLFLIPLEDQRR